MADDDEPLEPQEPLKEIPKKKLVAYKSIITDIFFKFYKAGSPEFEFDRAEIQKSAEAVGVATPKNLGDVIYAFRYRRKLPKEVLDTQPEGKHWLILGAGDAKYRFRLSDLAYILPTKGMMVRKIPDATPEFINKYKLNDEQGLLAKIRYNRLIDVFLGITAYSLQNHLRTKIVNYGQIEIDELYIGVDARGSQHVVPVQAKGNKDILGVIQTIQDTVYCKSLDKFAGCIVRTVSAQFMDDVIALFELHFDGNDVSIVQERHYKLTPAADISDADLAIYGRGGV
jgi:hypothetical protein